MLLFTACSGPAPATATPLPPGTPLPQPSPVFIAPQQQSTPTALPLPSPTGETPASIDAGAMVQAALATRLAQSATPTGALQEMAPTAEISPTPIAANADFTGLPSAVGIVRSDAVLAVTPGGAVVAPLSIATTLTVFGRSADNLWYAAATDTEQMGWVLAERVRVYGDVDQLAVIAAGELRPGIGIGSDAAEPAAEPLTTSRPPSAVTAPAETPPEGAAVVAVESANVRAGPGTDYPVVGQLQQNEAVSLIARNEAADWLQISLEGTATGYGWIYAPLITTALPLQTLPIAADDSPPAAPPPAEATVTTVAAPQQTTPVAGLRGTLVFQDSSGGTIYRYDLQTGQLAPITYGGDPAISPDGRTIAFVRGGGEAGVYLADIDGGNVRRIFGGNQPASPKWSKDGQLIVFNHTTGEGEPCRQTAMFGCIPQTQIDQLLEEYGDQLPPGFDLDRWPLVQMAHQSLSVVDVHGDSYRDLASLQTVKAQDWGTWGVVYHSNSGLEITEGQDLSITTKLADNYLYQDPDWQPGGERILFQGREGSHWEIFNVNSDGGGIFALTRPPMFGGEQPHHVAPAWSPDGQWVVLASNRGGTWGLWVMDSNGGNMQRLPIDVPINYAFQAEQLVDWGP